MVVVVVAVLIKHLKHFSNPKKSDRKNQPKNNPLSQLTKSQKKNKSTHKKRKNYHPQPSIYKYPPIDHSSNDELIYQPKKKKKNPHFKTLIHSHVL